MLNNNFFALLCRTIPIAIDIPTSGDPDIEFIKTLYLGFIMAARLAWGYF
jgi:hypothetical protein